MPIVPGSPQLISTDVPGAPSGVANAGIAQESLARFGSSIAETALKVGQTITTLEAQKEVSSAQDQDLIDSESYRTQQKLLSPDGYARDPKVIDPVTKQASMIRNSDGTYQTVTQQYREWANARYKDNQSKMGSALSQRLYGESAGKFFTTQISQAQSDELVQKTKAISANDDQRLQIMSDNLVSTPSVRGAYTMSDNFSSGVLDNAGHVDPKSGVLLGVYPRPVADEKIRKGQQQIFESALKGAYNQVFDAAKNGDHSVDKSKQISYWMSVLDGNDPDSVRRRKNGLPTFSDGLDPDRKAALQKEFISLAAITDKMDLSDLRAKTQAAYGAIDLGQKVPFNELAIPWKQAHDKKQVSDFEYAEVLGNLVAYDRASPVLSNPAFLLASPEEKQRQTEALKQKVLSDYQKFLPPDLFSKYPQVGGTMREKIVSNIDDLAAKTDKLAHDDFVKFSQMNPEIANETKRLRFDDLQSMWTSGDLLSRRSQQITNVGKSYFGNSSPDFRLISKDESKNLAHYLTDPLKSSGQVADGLEAMYSKDPRNYPAYLDQAIKDHSLSGAWRLVLGNSNKIIRAETVRVIRDGKKIRENAEAILRGKGSDTLSDFENSVYKEATPGLMGLTEQNQDSTVAADERKLMADVLVTKALDLGAQEGFSRGSKEYAKEAVAGVFSTRYHVESVGGGFFDKGARSSMIIPLTDERGVPITDADKVNILANRSLILEPQNLKNLAPVPKGSENLPPEQVWGQIAGSAKLIKAGDDSGYYIQYKDLNVQSRVRLMSAEKDRLGRPIPVKIPVSELKKPIPTKRPVQEAGGFFEKLYKSFSGSIEGGGSY